MNEIITIYSALFIIKAVLSISDLWIMSELALVKFGKENTFTNKLGLFLVSYIAAGFLRIFTLIPELLQDKISFFRTKTRKELENIADKHNIEQ